MYSSQSVDSGKVLRHTIYTHNDYIEMVFGTMGTVTRFQNMVDAYFLRYTSIPIPTPHSKSKIHMCLLGILHKGSMNADACM